MGIQLPGFAVSIGLLALLVVALIVVTGHCEFGVGFNGGHAEIGLH